MPGPAGLGHGPAREELGRQAKASGVDAHIDAVSLGPRRAGGHRGVLRLGSKWQRMDGPPAEKNRTATT